MTSIRGYMAMSLDGYIADVNGGYGFLGRYDGVDYGFSDFFGEIGTCVFGRTTWDQAAAMPDGLSFFKGKRFVVVTTRPLPDAPADRGRGLGPRRRVGTGRSSPRRRPAATCGSSAAASCSRPSSRMDAIDRMEACIIPVLLGDGIPMFPKAAPQERWLELADVRRFDKGGVILDYRRPAA